MTLAGLTSEKSMLRPTKQHAFIRSATPIVIRVKDPRDIVKTPAAYAKNASCRYGNELFNALTMQQEFVYLHGFVIRARQRKTPAKQSNSCQHNLQCAFKIMFNTAKTFTY